MITVKADFSRVSDQGRKLRVNSKRASGPLVVGTRVLAIEPAEDMEFTGVVESVDDAGFAMLAMDWEWAGDTDSKTVANDFVLGTVGSVVSAIEGAIKLAGITVEHLEHGYTFPSESSLRIAYQDFVSFSPASELPTVTIHVASGDTSELVSEIGRESWTGANNVDEAKTMVASQ